MQAWALSATVARRGAFSAATVLLTSCAGSVHLTFLNPQGPVAATQHVHFLEMVLVLAVFVALPIFILIPWLAWRYRYGATDSSYTPKWGYSNLLEIAAWTGPAVIVAFLAVLVWRSTHALDPYKPITADTRPLRILVIGYDWKWLFIYPDLGVASVGSLPIPVGRPIAMQLTSATVMQSLQIPALGGQIYAMGGMVTQLHLLADKPGRFMGENTMYNGDGFHQQHFTAVAMTPSSFNEWIKHTQSNGRALDARALTLIAERSTHAQLMKAFGMNAGDGGLYFNHATYDVFSNVVMATMSGTKSSLLSTTELPSTKAIPTNALLPTTEKHR
jgi:cytochrome o ubiquinol oxidase subunit 2